MPPIYVSQPGATVTTRGGRLRVLYRDQPLIDLPLAEVEQLCLIGRGVQISTPALIELVKRGVDVCYLSTGGRFFAKVAGSQGGAVHLRLAQGIWATDTGRTVALARLVVSAKLTNQARLLDHLGLDREAARVRRRLGEIPNVATLDALRGLEGAAASSHFQALGRLLPAEFEFRRRDQHPPPDPVNAVLSFGYTLLLNEVLGRIQVVGLDAYAGFLHALTAGRPSFALDLEEELRPLVDSLVLHLCRSGDLRPGDFHRPPEGVRLLPEARRRFLLAYERQLAARVTHPLARGRVTIRQAIELQVRQMGRLFLEEAAAFEPVRLDEIWPVRAGPAAP